ncbi:hypothetical protein [Paraburkholderia solisilvae]|uniref:Surface antigen n=1 Tax=Paraburkholderia solisilvae TaxID=624376 RepID=A0A6J5DWB6_9BURK|nr:hypothetical protein [Paraburkholderia solisilvae]CAB3758318.1 hypothetical protein LMG29739_02906 [Paraburkholderia solisilvae]
MRTTFGLAAAFFVCVGSVLAGGPPAMADEPEPPVVSAPADLQQTAQQDGAQPDELPQNDNEAPSGNAQHALLGDQQYAQQFAQPAEQADQGGGAVPGQEAAQECREVSGDADIDGQQQPIRGIACRQPDGTWRIQQQEADDNGGVVYPPPYDPYYGYGYGPYPWYPYDPWWGPPFAFGFGASFVFVDRFHHFHHINHVHIGRPFHYGHAGFHGDFRGGFRGGFGGNFHGGFRGGGGGFHGGGGGHR